MGKSETFKGAITISMRSRYWCLMVELHTVIIATNACRSFGATKLTYCLVVYARQLFSSEVFWKGDHCRCNACNHVFVDKSKWFWFNIISLHICSVLIHLSVCLLVEKLLFTKTKKKKQHTSPTLLLMFLSMSFAKGFLKKNLKQTHFHGLKQRFCTYFVHV